MLTLKDFDSKVLVSYLYTPNKLVPKIFYKIWGPTAELETIKGQKRGVVVSIGDGIIGWSLCNIKSGLDGDKFDKAKGIDLALRRAKIASQLTYGERRSFYQKVPFSIKELFDMMDLRSQKYFQIEQESEIYSDTHYDIN